MRAEAAFDRKSWIFQENLEWNCTMCYNKKGVCVLRKAHYERLKNTTMAMNYDKLWKLLIDKKMNRTDLHE